MRLRLSLCVNYKLTSAGGLIDFCLSGPPKAWLLFCGVYPEHRPGVLAHLVCQPWVTAQHEEASD